MGRAVLSLGPGQVMDHVSSLKLAGSRDESRGKSRDTLGGQRSRDRSRVFPRSCDWSELLDHVRSHDHVRQ